MDTRYLKVLSFWFEGDIDINYRTKWFPSDGSNDQLDIDKIIYNRFYILLQKAEINELIDWKKTPGSFLGLILILDQFSRHIYRGNNDKIKKNDKLALQFTYEYLETKWHLYHLPIPQIIFLLMPLRHSPTIERLENIIKIIQKVKDSVLSKYTFLLNKFENMTIRRLETLHDNHLSDTTTNNILDIDSINENNENILERHEFILGNEAEIIINHPLYKAMYNFLKERFQQIDFIAECIGISLSGGVDSMVIAKLLVALRSHFNNFKIIAVHIDYGNRNESLAESIFVKNWSNKLGILCEIRRIDEVTRGITKREDYEKISREIRYNFYDIIMKKYKIPGMFFGHHKGDVQENVISNMMKGISLLDLNGMDKTSIVNGVCIWRPFLSFTKDIIFNFAHTFGVPYFKDTTPKWSTRGKLRNRLIPLLSEMYGNGFLNNLSGLGNESIECRKMLHNHLFSKLWNKIIKTKVGIYIPCNEYLNQGFFFWKETLRFICHEMMGIGMVREKSINELLTKFNKGIDKNYNKYNNKQFNGTWVTLKKDIKSYLTNNYQLVIFSRSFFNEKYNNLMTINTRIELDKVYCINSWSIHAKVINLENQEEIDCLKEIKHLNVTDIIENEGISYVIPYDLNLEITQQYKIPSLRYLDKKILNVIPIVDAKRTNNEQRIDKINHKIVIQLKFMGN